MKMKNNRRHLAKPAKRNGELGAEKKPAMAASSKIMA
jgi:hypothetical protein